METVKKQDVRTRQRLLESACKIFAEKGYRDATVAEICEAAGANVASINYYFGDKEKLYVEAWRLAFNRSLKAYPSDGGVSADAPTEERFRGRILAVIKRFADPNSYEFEIMTKEIANPTGLLAEVVRKSIEPLRYEFLCIIRELLGPHAFEQQVKLCQMSIMAQCLHLTIQEKHGKAFAVAGMKTVMLPENFTNEEIAEHIICFSLAGIREIRHQIETEQLTHQNHSNKAII